MTNSAQTSPILEINDLHVSYGQSKAVQGVNLTLQAGSLSVVGRNGMGKTTLCNTIVGLTQAQRGSIYVAGKNILGLSPDQIVKAGVAYVPQGRRVWPSLSVDEHLRLVAKKGHGTWTVQRIYALFPRLAERKNNGGAQLSGGEQQMLAIGRALLSQPKLLIMDEPTEGLSPAMVGEVVSFLQQLTADHAVSVLLIEQNMRVATRVSEDVAIMLNGSINQTVNASVLANDRELQQRYLGVKSADDKESETHGGSTTEAAHEQSDKPLTDRASSNASNHDGNHSIDTTADSQSVTQANTHANTQANTQAPSQQTSTQESSAATSKQPSTVNSVPPRPAMPQRLRIKSTVAALMDRRAYVVGTFDTKARELQFIQARLEQQGIRTITVDISTSGKPSSARVTPREVARYHHAGADAVFTGDRGSAVAAMTEALCAYIAQCRDVGGIISAAGSGGTAMVAPAMRLLPVGLPKLMVSTIASGDVRPYVGPADITMMYSVTDIQGINSISELVLGNAANALAGMIGFQQAPSTVSKPAIGLSMFGVTTPCVQQVTKKLQDQYECLVFHATGVGGQSMEKLVDSNMLHGVLDITTTEIADHIAGGIFSAGAERLDIFAEVALPYVGSCGALDMVNFAAKSEVPERYQQRNLYEHNPQVTLMRSNAEESEKIGRFIAHKLNQMRGPVRFLLPTGGVSMLSVPGQPFHDPEADAALFSTIENEFQSSATHQLIKLPYDINAPEFSAALVSNFNDIIDQFE